MERSEARSIIPENPRVSASIIWFSFRDFENQQEFDQGVVVLNVAQPGCTFLRQRHLVKHQHVGTGNGRPVTRRAQPAGADNDFELRTGAQDVCASRIFLRGRRDNSDFYFFISLCFMVLKSLEVGRAA